MATNFTSSTTSAGSNATAAQYNNLRKDVLQNGGDYATSGGSANAYTLSIDAAISAYAAGQVFKFKSNFANTGAATLNVNAIGAKTIKKNLNEDLVGGDIKNGQIVTVIYDGTNLQIQSVDSQFLTSDSLTTGEAIDGTTTPQAVAVDLSDNLLYKADANNTSRVKFIGFINISALITTTPSVITHGVVPGFTGLTIGATYYVSDTAGSISSTPSTTTSIQVGIAVSATELLIMPGKRIASGTISHSAAAGANDDQTITLGFRPAVIMVQFEINSVLESTLYPSRGNGQFFGTTLMGAFLIGQESAGADVNMFQVMTTYVKFNDITSITVTSGTNKSRSSYSINSVSNTGFVSRLTNTITGGAGGTVAATGTVKYIAFE